MRYLRRPKNGGFIANCNDAAAAARGRYLVFLNNDTRVVPNWLDELIGSFAIFPRAGLVGSKLYNSDGSLQEAGGIIGSGSQVPATMVAMKIPTILATASRGVRIIVRGLPLPYPLSYGLRLAASTRNTRRPIAKTRIWPSDCGSSGTRCGTSPSLA